MQYSLPTAAGFVKMRVDGAVLDSGAQVKIIPASRLRAGKIELCNVKAPKVELSAANGAKMNVIGEVKAHINATSTSGEQFRTTSKVCGQQRGRVLLKLRCPDGTQGHNLL